MNSESQSPAVAETRGARPARETALAVKALYEGVLLAPLWSAIFVPTRAVPRGLPPAAGAWSSTPVIP